MLAQAARVHRYANDNANASHPALRYRSWSDRLDAQPVEIRISRRHIGGRIEREQRRARAFPPTEAQLRRDPQRGEAGALVEAVRITHRLVGDTHAELQRFSLDRGAHEL